MAEQPSSDAYKSRTPQGSVGLLGKDMRIPRGFRQPQGGGGPLRNTTSGEGALGASE
jgi:hypothetical protein